MAPAKKVIQHGAGLHFSGFRIDATHTYMDSRHATSVSAGGFESTSSGPRKHNAADRPGFAAEAESVGNAGSPLCQT